MATTDKFLGAEELGCHIPTQSNTIVRVTHPLSHTRRERVMQSTEYNYFAFPASMLVCDFLSDSGVSAMTDVQWSALFRGDEAYGRNHGYFALVASIRDILERGCDNPNKLVDFLTMNNSEQYIKVIMDELSNPVSGGFVNGGINQLIRPNFFIVPQGRAAESLLFSTLHDIWACETKPVFHNPECVVKISVPSSAKKIYIPSNGFFDTSEAHVSLNGFVGVNMFKRDFLTQPYSENIDRFAGNMDVEQLQQLIDREGADQIPVVWLTITNNTVAGQPVSMSNIKQVAEISHKNGIPLLFDAARYAENAYFIKKYEEGYGDKTILQILKEMFSYCDGFIISGKRDGVANIGAALCFRDQGLFHQRFSKKSDVGIVLKEKQILNCGNDSYGGLSGREIMVMAAGLYQGVNDDYLTRRVEQVSRLGFGLSKAGVRGVVLPPGGHAVYINMDQFMEDVPNRTMQDFSGVGFVLEMIRLYGIRCCEVGPFAFEWDQKKKEQQDSILNLVRLAVPRNMYTEEHINYTIDAIAELYKFRHMIPKVYITRGAELHLRHFQSGLQPIYHNGRLEENLSFPTCESFVAKQSTSPTPQVLPQ